MTENADALKSLHTALIDSRNGYEEALEEAEGKGLTPLFREMIALRTKHADEIAPHLAALGEEPDDDGSFMSTVHRTVIGIRALLTGLDESILPGLIDGEERILNSYDEAIKAAPAGSPEQSTLVVQRDTLRQKVNQMRARKARAA